jgi:E3 ubiquitin-protein ligase SIAH1
MEGKTNGSEIKAGADGPVQGEGTIVLKRMRHVTMGMEVLDCPVCSAPLSPPIFQVKSGAFLCIRCHHERSH